MMKSPPDADLHKMTSVIYYLYFHKKMFPHSVAGSHHIDDVFEAACNVMLNMTAEAFESKMQAIEASE